MRYQSIIRFLEYTGITVHPDEVLVPARIKKLVVAEFALQSDGIITLEDIDYTKNEIFSELEHPDFQDRMRFHYMIWQQKNLLLFLEKESVSLEEIAPWEPLMQDEDFIDFVSPYFAPAFDNVMKVLLQRKDMDNAAYWLGFIGMVSPDDEERALLQTRLFLDDAIRLFRNLNDQSYMARKTELELWYYHDWFRFVNQLPEDMYYYAEELATEMINFTVRIEKKDKLLCFNLSKKMIHLNVVSFNLRKLIRNNHGVFEHNYEKTTLKGKVTNFRPYHIFVGIFIIIRILLWSDACNDNDDINIDGTKFTQTFIDTSGGKSLRLNYQMEYFELNDSAQKIKMDNAEAQIFDTSLIYLLLQAPKEKGIDVYPFAVENKTGRDLFVYLIGKNDYATQKIESGKYLSFNPATKSNSIDMAIMFHETELVSLITQSYNQSFQFLDIGNKFYSSEKQNTLSFCDPDSVDMPVIMRSSLDTLPCRLQINEQEGKIRFSTKGRGRILNYRTENATTLNDAIHLRDYLNKNNSN